MPKIERKEQVLHIPKPEIPLTKGYMTAADLSAYFTTYSSQAYDNMARRLKVTAYKFKDDMYKTYYSLEEILEVAEPAKLTPMGMAFIDVITRSKQKNGFVDWIEIEQEWEKSKNDVSPRPGRKVLRKKSRSVPKSIRDKTAPMSEPPHYFKDDAARAEYHRKELEMLAQKMGNDVKAPEPEKKVNGTPDLAISQAPAMVHQPVLAPTKRYSDTTMVMKPMSFDINVTLETEDPEVLMELREIYRRIIELRNRIEPAGREKRKEEEPVPAAEQVEESHWQSN